jgi:hypothetical protein
LSFVERSEDAPGRNEERRTLPSHPELLALAEAEVHSLPGARSAEPDNGEVMIVESGSPASAPLQREPAQPASDEIVFLE